MIYLLYTPNSLSCNKAINFFKKNNLSVVKINPFLIEIDDKLIYDILFLTYEGFKDILNLKYKPLVENNIDIQSFTMKEIIHYIKHEPGVLKKPIIIEYINNQPYKLMIGYNKEDIKIFLRH